MEDETKKILIGTAIVSTLGAIGYGVYKAIRSRKKKDTLSFELVGGLEKEKELLKETIKLPLEQPEVIEKLGIQPAKGILLHGPPGCGKTLLARAVANEMGAAFYLINGPEIISKWVGETEQTLRRLFGRARRNAPSIIFIDELDSIAPNRDLLMHHFNVTMVDQLLALMDGMKPANGIVVIGATNRVDAVDPALRRKGRFDHEVKIGMPNEKSRFEILKVHTLKMPLSKDVNLKSLANKTKEYSGADIAALCREAGLQAYRKKKGKSKKILSEKDVTSLTVSKEDFDTGFKIITPWGKKF